MHKTANITANMHLEASSNKFPATRTVEYNKYKRIIQLFGDNFRCRHVFDLETIKGGISDREIVSGNMRQYELIYNELIYR